jgi:hypothetical protein
MCRSISLYDMNRPIALVLVGIADVLQCDIPAHHVQFFVTEALSGEVAAFHELVNALGGEQQPVIGIRSSGDRPCACKDLAVVVIQDQGGRR